LTEKRVYQVTIDGKRVQVRIEEYLVSEGENKSGSDIFRALVRQIIKKGYELGVENLTAFVREKLFKWLFR